MPAAKADPEKKVMRVKLDCIRAARKLLPEEASAAAVVQLGGDLYRWVSDDRPRARRNLRKRLRKQAIRATWAGVEDDVLNRLVQAVHEVSARRRGGRKTRLQQAGGAASASSSQPSECAAGPSHVATDHA
jgi:hypothetical protein